MYLPPASKDAEIEKLKVLSEKLTNQKLKFHQYSSYWVYLGSDIVVKVSKRDLQDEIDFVSYLASLDFPALKAISHHKLKGYYFYIYPKGETDISQQELVSFLGENLTKLHDIDIPKDLKLVTYAEEVKSNLSRWTDSYNLIPKPAMEKINKSLERSFDLSVECISHGDPIYGNMVRIDGKLFLIDWEHLSKAPKELDLAIIKYHEMFGEPPETFKEIAKKYGAYSEERLQILFDARAAYSIVWYAKNVHSGYFKDDGELGRRIARLMGDESIVYVKAV